MGYGKSDTESWPDYNDTETFVSRRPSRSIKRAKRERQKGKGKGKKRNGVLRFYTCHKLGFTTAVICDFGQTFRLGKKSYWADVYVAMTSLEYSLDSTSLNQRFLSCTKC